MEQSCLPQLESRKSKRKGLETRYILQSHTTRDLLLPTRSQLLIAYSAMNSSRYLSTDEVSTLMIQSPLSCTTIWTKSSTPESFVGTLQTITPSNMKPGDLPRVRLGLSFYHQAYNDRLMSLLLLICLSCLPVPSRRLDTKHIVANIC
jgi:hypothetical protein